MLTIKVFKKHRRVLTILLAVGAVLFACGCSSNSPSGAPTAETHTSPPPAPAQVSSSAYENKLVRRPGNSVEDGKVYVIQNGKKRWVVNASWFADHGFKFPNDVREISGAELDAIPAGDPIQ